ncbi:E3 ubiquitin-protein ligase Praja-1 isoform X2 [Tenrec ecaudatus]
MHRSAASQTTKRSRSPFPTSRRSWDGSESSGSSLNVDNEDSSRYLPREYRAPGNRRGMAYGHIDSHGTDDSEEEGAEHVQRAPGRGETGKFKDGKLYDPEKGARPLAGMPPQFSSFNCDVREKVDKLDPASAVRCSARRAECMQHNGMSSAEDKVSANGNCSEQERQEQNSPEYSSRAPVSMCAGGGNALMSSEGLVVRPKIRNLPSPNCAKPKIFFDTDDDDDDDMPHSLSRWRDTANTNECYSDGRARRGRGKSSNGYSELRCSETKKEARNDQVKTEKLPRRRRTTVDADFWTYSEDYYRHCDEDSDSDKEWAAALRRKYRGQEKNLSSSGDSWETLPGKEEHGPEPLALSAGAGAGASPRASAGAGASSNGSNFLAKVQEPSPQKEERASLEEGEIPWLQYNENESSSEGDNDSGREFMHPGVFMLDGNNNLEDDSSVSEDLEVDWSLFDGFADGLGVAEAISYVDPQFLTYMALEERLAQAMETALAHLESLAVDVEVANPPASKESIDTLPEIKVTEDHSAVGQEMCCPICCSEYVKGEVATELPCHHYFHKPCVSIWLQKSGTCPVCRCMFPPPL